MAASPAAVSACPRCGYPNAADATTCAGCGAAVARPKSGAYAGFGRRLAAHLLDWLAVAVIAMAALGVAAVAAGTAVGWSDEGIDEEGGTFDITLFVVWGLATIVGVWLYFAIFDSGRRATFGRFVMGIRVRDLEGREISFGRATGRHFGAYLTHLIPFYIGHLMMLWTQRKQTLHDYMASTIVVKVRD